MATSELDRLRAENTHLQQELNEERGPGQDGYRKAVAHLHSENTRQASRLVELERVYEINAELTQANTRLRAAVESLADALRSDAAEERAEAGRLDKQGEAAAAALHDGSASAVQWVETRLRKLLAPTSDSTANCQPETR